jgi:hypothetical protein
MMLCRASPLAEARRLFFPWQSAWPRKTRASSRPSPTHGHHLRPSTHCETLSGRSLLGMPQTQEVRDSVLVTEQGYERIGEELAGGRAQMQPVGH